jgi:hypothetical protein
MSDSGEVKEKKKEKKENNLKYIKIRKGRWVYVCIYTYIGV